MTIRKSTLRISTRMACAVLASAFFVATPIVATFAPAQAQQQGAVSVEFRGALEPYGRWERHSRWGEVWVPAKVSRDWRPYTVGRWVYSNDWGWYWVSDEEEADWAGPFITAAGYPIVSWVGRGFPARSGARVSSSGGAAVSELGGPHCRRMISWSTIETSRMCGYSAGRAISSPLRGSPP